MMSEVTLGEVLAELRGHVSVDQAEFAAIKASHAATTSGMARIETAIVDHAKASAETLDRMNTRTHARMDGIVASIVKLADNQGEIKDALHAAIVAMTKGDADADNAMNKKISATKEWILGGAVMLSLPVIGWLAVELWGTK